MKLNFIILFKYRDEIALWSDLHILGYLLNEKYQRDPIAWSNIQCEKWYEQRQQEPLYDYEQDLYPCPCNLSQAIADRGRWRPAPFCDINKAGMEDRNDYCRYREDIVHCVINVIHRYGTCICLSKDGTIAQSIIIGMIGRGDRRHKVSKIVTVD